jgi:hypothetical protein
LAASLSERFFARTATKPDQQTAAFFGTRRERDGGATEMAPEPRKRTLFQ